MATKIITLDDHFATGEPTVQLVSTWGRAGRVLREKTSLHKVASTRSPAMDYINSVEPEPGKSIVLVVGLGDHETYGPNRNGDGFPSEPIRGKIAAHEVLPQHYHTYENAHVFEHHANSDPSRAIGSVKKAFWNPHMRRVEVVEDFIHEKAPHLLEKIAANEFPAKSMGCRIKYDVCTICGNKAKTRADYCDHLKYEMSRIYPNGKQAAALNPSPDFFDSSWVIRPADRTGYMLKKVARDAPYEIRTASFDLGEVAERLQQKAAAIRKAAEIEKMLAGEPKASVSSLNNTDQMLLRRYARDVAEPAAQGEKPLSSKAMKIIIEYTPSEAQGTMQDMGLPMGLSDLLRYFFGRMGGNEELPPELCQCATKHASVIYDIYARYPRFLEQMENFAEANKPLAYNEKLARSFGEWAQDELVGETPWREENMPRTNMISYQDPVTGHQSSTTVGAARQTEGDLYKHNLKKSLPLIGAGALLAPVSPLLGLGMAGYGTYNALAGNRGPNVQTQQGPSISAYTEMVPKTAALAPELHYVVLRTRDYPVEDLSSDVKADILNRVKTAELHDDESPLLGPTLDLETVCQIIGESLFEHAA